VKVADCAVPACAECRGDLGVAPPELFENRNCAQTWRRLQDRDDLANVATRVRPSPATRNLLPGRQPRIILDPVASRRVEAGFDRSNGSIVALSVTDSSGGR
jgi:hypothetical protein